MRLACQAQVVGDVQIHRLIHDAEDFGLLRNESKRKRAARNHAGGAFGSSTQRQGHPQPLRALRCGALAEPLLLRGG